MEENGAEQEESIETNSPVEVNWKSQAIALVTLVPVLGVLWLGIEYLPRFGDWVGEKADRLVESGGKTEEPEQIESSGSRLKPVGESSEERVPDSNSISASSNRDADFRIQIEEQLGGPERVEVRHLAVSDDESRLVAALKIFEEDGDGRLVEVFFERDDFGRYLSTEESPLDQPLTLWAK